MEIFESNQIKKAQSYNNEILNSQHKKIVNNLMNIKTQNDTAVFAKLNNINQDLSLILEPRDLEKIFTNPEFKIKIKRNTNFELVNQINDIKTVEEYEKFAKENFLNTTPITLKKLKENFLSEIENIKNYLLQDQNFFIKKWKMNLLKVNSWYQETNIWPLFVSTFFVGLNNLNVILYAPLLLKEVEIIIKNNEVYLVSRSSTITLNEKATFLIENNLSFEIPKISKKIEQLNFNNTITELLDKTQNIFSNNKNFVAFMDKFVNFKNKKNFPPSSTLKIYPGFILNMCSPTGGKLREVVINLIHKQKIDNLVNIDLFKNYHQEATEKLLQKESITRITPTDISQEHAIIAALDNSAIIIGPPGTGKSQTIANLLTNILKKNKKALFISQKKEALDVVIKRMGPLADLILQFSHQKQNNAQLKEEFYKTLKNIVNYIKNNFSLNLHVQTKSFLSDLEINNAKKRAKIAGIYNPEIFRSFLKILNTYKNVFENKNNLNNLSYKKVTNDILSVTNSFNDLNHFMSYWNHFEMGKKLLALRLNKTINKKFLGLFSYSKIDPEFSKLYNLIGSIKNSSICKFEAAEFSSFFVIKNSSLFNSYYEQHLIDQEYQNNLKNKILNNTASDSEIMDIVYQNTNKLKRNLKIHLADQQFKKMYKSFSGRVERAFTPPTIFISLFKKILKIFFNIIVGTPEQLEHFVDFENEKYDYVIFDEASQMFFEKAIPFVSIGKNIVVAGDDQQMKPSNWFRKRWEDEDSNEDEAEYNSLLDWAKQQSFPSYYLEMNYRSVSSELVLFSSKQFYKSKLKGLDNVNLNNSKVIEVVECNGFWINNSNEFEANKLLEIAQHYLDKYKTIILLTFNAKQQDLITNKIIDTYPAIYQKLKSKNLKIKNLENIQGDEADLVIVSVAYDKTTRLGLTYVTTPQGKNALNVAITRAKEKMIVLKSLKAHDVKINNTSNNSVLIFKEWLSYLETSSQNRKMYAPVEVYENDEPDSYFEVNVIEWLKKQNFKTPLLIQNQFVVGSYKIDVAILDKNTKKFLLGIEIDGLKYHSGLTRLINDRKRQDFIEAKGYRIYRISENAWNEDRGQIFSDLQIIIDKAK